MRNRATSWLFVCLTTSGLGSIPIAAAAEIDGAKIYQNTCAACHGEKGEGTDVYKSPLIGDLSVSELAAYISKTMPEGSPEDCVGDDAQAVAQYIHDAFYSPIAQARNRPARIELSRLTVRQYRQALADLIGGFRPPASWDRQRGLQGEYFTTRQFQRNRRAFERVDPVVNFDFGEGSPDEKIKPAEFAIRWNGSVIAPKSGEYQIILHSTNAVRLWLNDPEKALIDARVRSGNSTEYKATISLLGGRAHFLRLELFKHKDDVTSVRLEWTPPSGVAEVIPTHCLTPRHVPELFVSTTPFPPDDSSMGFERGISISNEWERATTYGALEAAGYVDEHLNRLAGGSEAEKLRAFCLQFVERAFRKPLTEAEREFYIDRQFQAAEHPQEAVKRVVLLTLKSPRFLYLEPGRGEFDDFAVASWLSFGLWDSLPDRALLEQARAGKLRTPEEIAAQASRMADDHRTRYKLREFVRQWLNLDHIHDLSKDPERFPGFDRVLAADLETSLELFLEDLLYAEHSDFRRLMLTEETYLNDRLAKFYEAALNGDGEFELVKWQPEHRAGVLSHPYLLAGFAYREASSPIHRGVLLTRNILGRMLKPPPIAVAPLAVDLHPDLTTRERVILQTNSDECMRCHKTINDLGFALENFDAVGRYRTEEHSKPINAEGIYVPREGDAVRFNGVKELAQFLATSEEVHASFAERLFQYLTKQPVRAIGEDFLAGMCDNFRANEFDIRRLAAFAIADSASRMRNAQP